MNNQDELTYDWVNLNKKLLEKAYEYANITPGFDLGMLYVDSDDYDANIDIITTIWEK